MNISSSLFEADSALLGGALRLDSIGTTTSTSFIGNTATEGGAVYGTPRPASLRAIASRATCNGRDQAARTRGCARRLSFNGDEGGAA
jgi:predicted outer membrane repeat protein